LFVASFALFFEFSSPGLGIGGFVSLLCFLLFFWSQFLQGTAGWLEVLLFAGGISCVILEIFVIPGFGIFGLGGGAMIITSLVLASQTVLQIPQNEYQITELRNSLLTISAAGAGLAVSVFLARKYAHQMPLLKNVLLIPPAGDDLDELVYRESLVDFSYLLGQDGTTTTKLTPAGKARFAEELIDVVSQGELLPANTTVQVVEVHGNRVVVARVI
jgi:membrane-bound ClpP family serine protease